MCRKCYPITSDFKNVSIAPYGIKPPVWRILDRISGDLFVLSQLQNDQARYAPLFIHSFVLCAPRKILEATQFNQSYQRYEDIENVSDRLRWCRHSRGLLQAEVAQRIGVSSNVYKNIEDGITQQIPKEVADKLSQLYEVPVTDFLDAYNRFLYIGQAQCIREYREKMGLGKKAFARAMGIPIRSLQGWESGRKVISRQNWERCFKRLFCVKESIELLGNNTSYEEID